MQLELTKNNI